MPWLKRLRQVFFPLKNPRPNLGLIGDLDDVEILEDVERIFGVSFSDSEAEMMRNLGDFFDITERKLRAQAKSLEWGSFVEVIEPHCAMNASEMSRETEFFSHI